MYYGIKDGMIKCKSNKIVNLHKDIEFHIELNEIYQSGDFYNYDTKEITINPDSVNRNPKIEKSELEILQEKYDRLEDRIKQLESK